MKTPLDSPNPTWADIKSLAWSVSLVFVFIAVGAFGARVLIGEHGAFLLAIGLMLFVILAFALIVGASLLISYGAQLAGYVIEWWDDRRRADS
ncbi:MAG: hypothetical protein V4617_02860 [Gemmatimonadota bacterium]